MSKRLQNISFRASKYFRPLEPWHCGGMENGETCAAGPDKYGRCRALAERQADKQENTWQCKPVRNLRYARTRFAYLGVALVLALSLSAVIFDFWQTTTSAGPLSRHHVAFGEQSCASCHTMASVAKTQWLDNLIKSHLDAQADSKKCLACHVLGATATQVHGLPTATLKSLGNKSSSNVQSEAALESLDNMGDFKQNIGALDPQSMLLNFSKRLISGRADQLACNVCHQEHLGGTASITAVSDQQCAVCHTNSFASLSQHVNFSDYPAERRTGIIFNHNSHLNKHFQEQKVPESAPSGCMGCHALDSEGQTIQIISYQQSCSSCHDAQVSGQSRASDKGIAMLSIPGLDTDTLRARGVDVGAWPAYSDAELTPLLRLLLVAYDADLAKQLSESDALDLFDLTQASDQQLQLVYNLAWRIKQIYFELQRGGGEIVLNRIIALGDAPQALLGLLSPEVVDAAVQAAFPQLQTEVATWLAQGLPALRLQPIAPLAQASEPLAQASAPLAEGSAPLSKTKNSASVADDDWLASALSDDTDGLSSSDDDDWLSEAVADDKSDASDDNWLEGASGEIVADDAGDDWLNDAVNASDDEADDDWLEQQANSQSNVREAAPKGDVATTLDTRSPAAPQIKTPSQQVTASRSREDRAAAGGWYYETFYIYYRPAGHADQLVAAWIDYLVDHQGSARGSHANAVLLKNFTNEDNPGACGKCHSVEKRAQSGLLKVNWRGAEADTKLHDFNRFKHQSHFPAIELTRPSIVSGGDKSVEGGQSGCISCHQLNAKADSAASYAHFNASVFQSDFSDLDKSQCVDCHQTNAQLQSCTQCHNYHIGERGLQRLSNTVSSQAESE